MNQDKEHIYYLGVILVRYFILNVKEQCNTEIHKKWNYHILICTLYQKISLKILFALIFERIRSIGMSCLPHQWTEALSWKFWARLEPYYDYSTTFPRSLIHPKKSNLHEISYNQFYVTNCLHDIWWKLTLRWIELWGNLCPFSGVFLPNFTSCW